MTQHKPPVALERTVIEMEIRMQEIIRSVEALKESTEGTLRTRGLKDRLMLAENDIERNKKAWENLTARLDAFEINMMANLREAFTEVKIDIAKRFDGLRAEADNQKTLLNKFQPIINLVSWVMVTAGGIILGLLLTGKWQILIH